MKKRPEPLTVGPLLYAQTTLWTHYRLVEPGVVVDPGVVVEPGVAPGARGAMPPGAAPVVVRRCSEASIFCDLKSAAELSCSLVIDSFSFTSLLSLPCMTWKADGGSATSLAPMPRKPPTPTT